MHLSHQGMNALIYLKNDWTLHVCYNGVLYIDAFDGVQTDDNLMDPNQDYMVNAVKYPNHISPIFSISI